MNLKMFLKAATLATMLAGTMALPACKTRGPAEKTGEAIDDAADTVKDKTKDAADEVKDAAKDVKEGVKDAADDLKK